MQGVHKVLLQFKNVITKAVDEISYIDLFYINQCFVFQIKFLCVNKPLQNGYSTREGTIFLDVLGRPLLTVSNTDPAFTRINFWCHR